MVTLKIRRDNLKRFSRRIFRVTMSYQSSWLIHFCQSLMMFYCCNCNFTAGIQFYHWKCSFIARNTVLLQECRFNAVLLLKMPFYFRKIILSQKLWFYCKNKLNYFFWYFIVVSKFYCFITFLFIVNPLMKIH
jgi:hypothetical protein